MENVKIVNASTLSVWRTKDGEVPMIAMTDDHLVKARTTVQKRIKINNQQLKINSKLLTEIDREIDYRERTERVSVKDITEIIEGQRVILNNEIVLVENLQQCKEGLTHYIQSGQVFKFLEA